MRRALVIASAALMATAVAIIWFDAAGPGWHLAYYLASAALALAGVALLRLAVRAHLRGSDERLASARDAAYCTSYWILAPAIAI